MCWSGINTLSTAGAVLIPKNCFTMDSHMRREEPGSTIRNSFTSWNMNQKTFLKKDKLRFLSNRIFLLIFSIKMTFFCLLICIHLKCRMNGRSSHPVQWKIGSLLSHLTRQAYLMSCPMRVSVYHVPYPV